jgi:AcrR family transcriptional regulator
MTLYRHIPSKDDLILAMIDHALGEEPFPARMPQGWRAPLELSCRLMWTVFRRHPWVAGAMTVSRPQLLPNALPLADWVFRALERTRLSAGHKLYVHVTLFSFVRGVALSAESETQAIHETGIDADQWIQGQAPQLQRLASAHGFTAIARIMTQEIDFDLEGVFEFGLRQILDGVERNLGPLR